MHTNVFKKTIGYLLYLAQEKSSGHYVFKVLDTRTKNYTLVAVCNVTELTEFVCYSEAAKVDERFTIEIFRPIYEALEFHFTWFARLTNSGIKTARYPINKSWCRANNKLINKG